MANFSTASKVLQTIRSGDEVEWDRGENRVKINNAANCVPPLDVETAKKLGIKINVNWGELMVLLAHARRQYLSAFWSEMQFFKVELPFAPSEKKSEWEAFITKQINRPMRKSLKYFELHRSRWAAVVCHGIGPQVWYHKEKWCPDFLAIEDLRIPTDTTLDFENLDWFSVRHVYTVYELVKEVFNDKETNHWDKKAVAEILKNYKQLNFDTASNKYDWETTPEKLAELVKQNGGFYSSDALPGIPLWRFYFKDDSEKDNKGWFMRIVPESATVRGGSEEKFLWTSDEPVCSNLAEIMHCQFGDLNNKSPFLYPAVRSLGFALLEPTFYTNLTRCRLLQHVHDNFNVWLRISDPVEKARAMVQEFGNYNVVRSGIGIIPQNERHQIDANLVDSAMAQLKQLQSEASASYTQQTDTGTKREQTAFETSVKMQQVNAMMGGLLMTAFIYATHEYQEICRRFCLKDSGDPDVIEFQRRCKDAGIPAAFMNVSQWDIEPVTPLGMGNPTLAEAKADQLMAIRPACDPTAQQEILHEVLLVKTNDPRKAARWAPLGAGRGITDSQRDAQSIFGTLMQGVPLPFKEGLSAIEEFDTLEPMLAGVIVRCEKRDNMATAEEAQGMQTVVEYMDNLIQQIASDPAQKQRVKQYGDSLGKLVNQLKGLAQRGAEKAQQGQGGPNGVDKAKVDALMLSTAAKVRAKEMADQQKLKQKDRAFKLDQRRKDAETYHNLQRGALEAQVDASRQMNLEKE